MKDFNRQDKEDRPSRLGRGRYLLWFQEWQQINEIQFVHGVDGDANKELHLF